jgi:cysteinyl-tRNA synthetase
LEARKRKDFKEADRIRDELAAMGVVIKDSKDGTTWEVKR